MMFPYQTSGLWYSTVHWSGHARVVSDVNTLTEEIVDDCLAGYINIVTRFTTVTSTNLVLWREYIAELWPYLMKDILLPPLSEVTSYLIICCPRWWKNNFLHFFPLPLRCKDSQSLFHFYSKWKDKLHWKEPYFGWWPPMKDGESKNAFWLLDHTDNLISDCY